MCIYGYKENIVSYLISIIRPTTKFHFTMLIIKWEPSDVYLACAFKDARGHVQTTAVMFDHYIGLVRSIESLIRTVFNNMNRYCNRNVIYSMGYIGFHCLWYYILAKILIIRLAKISNSISINS